MTTPERTVEETFQKFWFYAGDWHNADCAFVCLDHGVCNCNTTANKKEITQTLKAERQKREEEVDIDVVKVKAIDGYNQEKIELTKMMREMGNKDFHLQSQVRQRMEAIDEKIEALTQHNNK